MESLFSPDTQNSCFGRLLSVTKNFTDLTTFCFRILLSLLQYKLFSPLRDILSQTIIVLAIFLVPSFTMGQEAAGIALSSYNGINGVRINPSGLVNSRLFYDVNFVSGDIFVENNFLFIHKEDFKFMDFFSRNPSIPSADVPGEGFDYNSNIELIRGFQQTDIMGPAFSITLGNQGFGFFTRAVTMTSVTNLPGYLGELMFEGLDYAPLHGIPQNHEKFNAASVGWWELGLSYAWDIKESNFSHWSVGFNLRRLWGYAGAHVVSYNADYTVENDSVIDIRNLDATVGFSIPLDYETNDFPAPGKTFKGRGTAIDIGVTFTRKKSVALNRTYKNYCQYQYDEPLYKIGLSVLNIGQLSFDENIMEERYDNISAEWRSVDTLEFVSLNNVMRQVSSVFYGDPNASSTGADRFNLGLGTAVSLQADYNYFGNWHLSTLVIWPLNLNDAQLKRPGQVLISPRYETDRFEVALPVSLYDFSKPRIGLSARFQYFTIGTEKLGGYLGFDDFYGLDFYFSVKFHILKGWCGRYKSKPDCSRYEF